MNRQVLVLASTSPRRVDLIKQLGIDFDVVDPGDVENSTSNDPLTRVREHAFYKAKVVAEKYPDRIIVAADTIVTLNGKIFEKPRNEEEAKKMLRTLEGKMHKVISAIALVKKSRNLLDVRTEETMVSIKKLNEDEIMAYVSTSEPMDKAGAYAAQGVGAVLIEKVNGCFYNVVGLPLSLLHTMLKKADVNTLLCASKNKNASI